jgi:hypothetical protein
MKTRKCTTRSFFDLTEKEQKKLQLLFPCYNSKNGLTSFRRLIDRGLIPTHKIGNILYVSWKKLQDKLGGLPLEESFLGTHEVARILGVEPIKIQLFTVHPTRTPRLRYYSFAPHKTGQKKLFLLDDVLDFYRQEFVEKKRKKKKQ